MKHVRSFLGVYWFGLLGLACGGAAPPNAEPEPSPAATPSSPVAADELCTVHCDRAEVCGVHRDACERDCPARGRPVSNMRHDFIGHMLLCLDGASCSSLQEGAAWKGCHEGVVKTLPVTESLRRFCFESSRRAARCGRGADADQAACLSDLRYQRDESLDAARRCFELPCAKVPGCMAAALTR